MARSSYSGQSVQNLAFSVDRLSGIVASALSPHLWLAWLPLAIHSLRCGLILAPLRGYLGALTNLAIGLLRTRFDEDWIQQELGSTFSDAAGLRRGFARLKCWMSELV